MSQRRPGETPFPAFPGDGADLLPPASELARRGYSLRQLLPGDLAWLQSLYADTRADEMAVVPWTIQTKRAFLDQQFALQHQHYVSHFATARFLAIELEATGPVGRLYLQCSAPRHLLIDICLTPSHRRQGVGSALVRQCQRHAAALGHGMALHVQFNNFDAQRLYQRLGFRSVEKSDSHWLMIWPSDDDPSSPAESSHVEPHDQYSA